MLSGEKMRENLSKTEKESGVIHLSLCTQVCSERDSNPHGITPRDFKGYDLFGNGRESLNP